MEGACQARTQDEPGQEQAQKQLDRLEDRRDAWGCAGQTEQAEAKGQAQIEDANAAKPNHPSVLQQMETLREHVYQENAHVDVSCRTRSVSSRIW
jgi:hypothetical protein